MRIKVFVGIRAMNAERIIQDWLIANPTVKILQVAQNGYIVGDWITVSIFYSTGAG
jgi:hypothetical protein